MLCRILGTAGGTVVGLAMSDMPRTASGSYKRITVSIIFGMLLSDAIGEELLGWSMIVPNRIVAASCLSAAFGWWIMHAGIRISQTWKN